MSKTRESFVEHFGEDEASCIEGAAMFHMNGIHDKPGSDHFRWAICICIGIECFSSEHGRSHHGIMASVLEIEQWIKDHGDLSSHDGDVDYLALILGKYDKFIPTTSEKQ